MKSPGRPPAARPPRRDTEAALTALRRALAGELRERRHAAGLTQAVLAERLGTSQARVARMEGADPGVSLDLLVRALLRLGADGRDIARVLMRAPPAAGGHDS
ncbi:MAG: helix-turn-helix domain-containing protein [Gemmatimonadetes bacterium]|nr:MAG: helix-turn-helix domain-containing protein [Gemmatimonadota bacterium]